MPTRTGVLCVSHKMPPPDEIVSQVFAVFYMQWWGWGKKVFPHLMHLRCITFKSPSGTSSRAATHNPHAPYCLFPVPPGSKLDSSAR